MKDFCEKYYEAAAPYILEYIELLHNSQERFNERLDIFHGPKNAKDTYLSLELYTKYNDLFDKACNSVLYNKDVLLRVQEARLPLYYSGIVLKYGTEEEQLKNIKEFAKIAKSAGLEKVEEFLYDSLANL